MICMTFAEKLELLIDRLGSSQSKLFRKTGIAQSAISEMTRKVRRPYFDQVQEIAAALKVSLDDLADDDLYTPPQARNPLTVEQQTILEIVASLGYSEAMKRLTITKPATPGFKDGERFEPPDIPNPHSAPKNGGSRKHRSG